MQTYNSESVKRLTDLELCSLIKQCNSNEALEELNDRHGALVVSIATRMSKKYDNWNITQKIIDDAYYIMYLSALKYKPDKKTKFSTFVGNETKWAYLNKCNKFKNQVLNTSKLELIMKFIPSTTQNKSVQNELLDCIYSLIDTHPDVRMHKIFKLRYQVGKNNNVMPWHLIGYKLGLSAQGCINIHNSGVSYLKEKLKKEGVLC